MARRFLRAGMKAILPKQRLGREIAAILAVKFVLLAVLFFAFFSPSHRLHPDGKAVSAHLLGGNNR
jgi:hypothetical protein